MTDDSLPDDHEQNDAPLIPNLPVPDPGPHIKLPNIQFPEFSPNIKVPAIYSKVVDDFARSIAQSPEMQALARRMAAQIPRTVFDDSTLARLRAFGTRATQLPEGVGVPNVISQVAAELAVQADAVSLRDDVAINVTSDAPQPVPAWAKELLVKSPAQFIAVAVTLYQLLLTVLPAEHSKERAALLSGIWMLAWVAASEAFKDRP